MIWGIKKYNDCELHLYVFLSMAFDLYGSSIKLAQLSLFLVSETNMEKSRIDNLVPSPRYAKASATEGDHHISYEVPR